MSKTKTKTAAKKHNCEIKDMIYCRNTNVRRLTGKKPGDPKFWCCWTCQIKLEGMGMKLKEGPT